MKPEYIVIHTAAYRGSDCDKDRIDGWHRDRGWSGIGYHFVILNNRHSQKKDGTIEVGRAEDKQGAHALGINDRSLGICCVGHGDYEDFTDEQYKSLYMLITELARRYDIPVQKVIGHCELNDLVDQEVIDRRYRTKKSCPGSKINMDFIRRQLTHLSSKEDNEISSRDAIEIKSAIAILHKHRNKYPNALDELDEFSYHPEVMEASGS
ncbi:hypothetical protein HBA55_33960 [Pseudomaricurvus alkylphenolicus]|uniref:N-acetylmuramoyl-L-alanine amidase n=1 Tax=Pseudomaricurvus alkylphenolicus TaxID=1306991 RepID=UPI00141EECBD|nr:N-acetylmuramoyl-L-alanine amidase [Pseudomaricurvus alkylphenolicus]NIB44638.1 hypothetical protein [Pseudomaricurvus alkylphenolicus]